MPHGRINAILLPYVINITAKSQQNLYHFLSNEYFIADQKYADISRRMNFPAYTNEEGVWSLINEIKKIKYRPRNTSNI